MSRSTRSHSRQLYFVPGLVLIGLAASAATTQAQSTDPERALLNRIPAPSYQVVVAGTQSPTSIDGARALLNSSTVAAGPSLAHAEARAVDGAQALLGTVSPSSPRLTLAW